MIPVLVQSEAVKSSAEGRLALWGELTFSDPWFLALLPVVIGAIAIGSARRRRVCAPIPLLPANVPKS